MDEHHGTQTTPTDRELLELALAQITEDAHVFDEAVASYNVHLENHRDRRDLHDLPLRQPITDDELFQVGIDGDREALERILSTLLDRIHLDSAVRCHPRVYPIHIEAVAQLEIARDQLVRALEDAIRRLTPDGCVPSGD